MIEPLGTVRSRAGRRYSPRPVRALKLFKLCSWATRQAYSFDPYHNLTKAQHRLVLGGETLLWSEQAGPENLDSIAW